LKGSSKHHPIRTCISCGEKRVKKELVRLVSDVNRVVKLDLRKSMPGRGAYVCTREKCMERAMQDRLLGKAFKVRGPFLCGFRESAK
jgi:uncharacterized protein